MSHRFATSLIGAFLAFCMALSAGTVQAQQTGNVVSLDVQCTPANIIDQAWTIEVRIVRPNQNDVTVSVNVPARTHEDAIAAFVADQINVACEDEDLASVTARQGEPDEISFSGDAAAHVTAKPKDGKGKGHIDIVHKNQQAGQGPALALVRIDVWLWHLLADDYTLTLTISGKRPNGEPYLASDSVVLYATETMAEKIQKIINKVNSHGFQGATLGTNGLRITPLPGGKTIELYTMRLGPIRDDDEEVGDVLYGIGVDHEL